MKTVVLLTLVAVAVSQYPNRGSEIVFPSSNRPRPSTGGPSRPGPSQCPNPIPLGSSQPRPTITGQTLGQQLAGRPALNLQRCQYPSGQFVHDKLDSSDYHFSWCYDGGIKYSWTDANVYCKGLGTGWGGVSIQNANEDNFVTKIIRYHELPYLWTSGSRQHTTKWTWSATNNALGYENWALTGGLTTDTYRCPQPDNNENSNEQCLGILNQFYPNDGITWHDIGCHHLKPIICERPRYSG